MEKETKNRVIYVDDEINNLKALSRLFRDEPFEFITFSSPVTALKKINELKPAVVISDQRMPEMNGIDFLENVRRMQPASVRIILTGHAHLEAAINAINKGHVYLYIQKPWDDEELKAQVKTALEHQESTLCLRNIVDTLVDEIIENRENTQVVRKLATALHGDITKNLLIIDGYTQLLQKHLKNDEIPGKYFSNIILQFREIEKTINKFKSLSRPTKTFDHE